MKVGLGRLLDTPSHKDVAVSFCLLGSMSPAGTAHRCVSPCTFLVESASQCLVSFVSPSVGLSLSVTHADGGPPLRVVTSLQCHVRPASGCTGPGVQGSQGLAHLPQRCM